MYNRVVSPLLPPATCAVTALISTAARARQPRQPRSVDWLNLYARACDDRHGQRGRRDARASPTADPHRSFIWWTHPACVAACEQARRVGNWLADRTGALENDASCLASHVTAALASFAMDRPEGCSCTPTTGRSERVRW